MLNNIFLGISFIIFSELMIVYLFFLVKYKILIPRKQIKENMGEKPKYYREIIDKYSPLMNAKLLGKDIFHQDVITAMVLYLKNKGWQDDQDFKEELLSQNRFMENEIVFMKYSKWIFRSLKEKNIKIGNSTVKEIVDSAVLNDLKKEKFIKKIPGLKYLNLIDALPFIFFMVNGTLVAKIASYNNTFMNNLVFIMELIVNFSWILIYSISVHANLNLQANLEKKGQEYVNQLNASKEFLKDFSILSSRKIDEEILWESYLRNAILFDLKGNLDQDAELFYKKLISKYEYLNEENNNFKFIKDYLFLFTIWLFIALVIKNKMFTILILNFSLSPLIYFYFIKKLYPYGDYDEK